MKRVNLIFSVLLLLIGQNSLAGYFQSVRVDQTIPYHCANPEKEYFFSDFDTATFSISNALQRGFNYEIQITRNEARQLWKYLKKLTHGERLTKLDFAAVDSNPRLNKYKKLILANYQKMGFDFGSEGEVLEILVLLDLKKEFSPEEYYFTGGIEYFRVSGPIMGELDIIVARKDNCKAVLIGESKLGLHRLGKAKEQIQRFVNFIRKLNPQTQLSN